MKNRGRNLILIASGLLFGAAGTGLAVEYFWRGSVLEGYLNSSSSWNPAGIPGTGDISSFRTGQDRISSPGEYTVKIPASGLEEGSFTYINGLPSGTKITFDATGTTWRKIRDAGTPWANNLIFRLDNADHIFNIEGVNSGNAGDRYGFTFSDGKISFLASEDGDQMTFEGGVFNNYKIDDAETAHSTILLHSLHRANSKIVMKPGSETHLREVHVRGQVPNGEWLIEGGDHHIYNGLYINTYDGIVNGVPSDGVTRITGGRLTVESGPFWLGRNKNGTGRLLVEEEGTFVHSNNAVYFPDTQYSQGELSISGNGKVVCHGPLLGGHASASTATVSVVDSGRLYVTNYIRIGENNDSRATLLLADNAYAEIQQIFGASGNGSSGDLTLRDNAELLLFAYGGALASGDNSGMTFSMTGNTRFTKKGGDLSFGDNKETSKIQASFTGGTFLETEGRTFIKGGRGSSVVFNGTTADFRELFMEGPQNLPGYTNLVRLASGDFSCGTNGGSGLTVCGNLRNTIFFQEGGTNTVGNMLRIGYGSTSDSSYCACYRLTNGELRITGVVNIADSNPSFGELELLGGRFIGSDIRGWTGSAARSGTGWAKVLFDGSTISPRVNNNAMMYTIDEAVLGATGCILDTDSKDCSIEQEFVDRTVDGAAVTGRFVKQGEGTLTVKKNSSHALTEITGGTLISTQAAAEFGREVRVLGGTLSLSGTPTTLTCEKMVFGRGSGFATIYLDQGDQIVITDANGLTGANGLIDGTWTGTNGTYPIFVCQNGLDASQLNRISVLNAVEGKTYTWTTAVVGTDIVASLVITDATPTGEQVWSGATSTDWATGVNWLSGTQPSATTTATFPANAVAKTVQTAAGAAASELAFTGDYTVSGTESLSVISQITSASGTQTFTAPLTFGRIVTIDAASGASVLLNGALTGFATDLEKTGSGKVTVSGLNAAFDGRFVANGGTLEVTSREAFGGNDLLWPVSLKSGTFAYSGADEAVVDAALRLDGSEAKTPLIINNSGNLTFTGVTHANGLLVKRGAGDLTLNLPAGNFSLGRGDGDSNAGENGGTPGFPASGDSPANLDGLYGVTLLEGTTRIVGVDSNKTVVSTYNTSLLGGNYKGDVPAVLEVVNAKLNFGAAGRHGCFIRDLPPNAPVPEIHLTNAYFWTDSMLIGYSTQAKIYPKILMKDSTFFNSYNSYVGNNNICPIIDADNSKMYSDGMIGWTVQGSEIQADFHGPDAMLGSLNSSGTGNQAGRFQFNDRVTGAMLFRDGAKLSTTRGIVGNNSGQDLVFDGGTFEILAHQTELNTTSTWNRAGTGLTTQGNGLTVDIAAGITHAFNFPVKGTGAVKKTGSGTWQLVESRLEDGDSISLLQHSGSTEVAEGTLLLNGALAAETTTFIVDEDATLDLVDTILDVNSISGEGTVQNGTLNNTAILLGDPVAQPLILEDVQLPPAQVVEIDFGGEEPDWGYAYAVARLVGDSIPENRSVADWRGIGLNVGGDNPVRCDFTLTAENVVMATCRKAITGTMLFIR